jgi:YydG family peptide modification radical SAM enzyme
MKDTYNKLVMIMHRKCNAKCSICCFSCTPESHEKLKLQEMLSYVDQAKDIDDITSVSLTGGEPFLEYRSLVQLIKRATENGLSVSTITNGNWATSYEKAYDRLLELKSYGLKYLNISHDKYHKEYVPTGCVKNVLDAALQLGIATTLVMVAKKEDSVGSIVNELGNGLYGTNLNVAPCLPVGAAADYSDEHFDRLLDVEGLRCVYGKNMVVGYEGTVFPCCSQVIYETGLGVGNYEEMTLQEAVSKLENNALLYLLRNEKMDFFIKIAREKLGIKVPDKVVNVCELCAKLFTKENIVLFYPYVMNRIKEVRKEHKNV